MRMIAMVGRRKPRTLEWELKVTTPDGTVLDLATSQLEAVWRMGGRSTDGFVDILQMPRVHLWVRPAGHVEPDRTEILDGTGAMEWYLREAR